MADGNRTQVMPSRAGNFNERASADQVAVSRAEPPRARGIGLVSDLWCPPFDDRMSDVIVDFDVHLVAGSGVYALELIEADRVRWRGFREFRELADGQLVVDQDGSGAAYEPARLIGVDFRVAGKVIDVFRRDAAAPEVFAAEASHAPRR